MSVSGGKAFMKIEFPGLWELRQEFKKLPKHIAARVIGAGLRRAAKPGEEALRKVTPKGPTKNLYRAIKTIVKKYQKNGAAVAIVGYVKAGTGEASSAGGGRVKKGKDRAFHQFWVEFGTKERRIKKPTRAGYIASSFNSLGPFSIKSNASKARRSRRLASQARRLIARAAKGKFQDEASAGAMMRRRAAGLFSESAFRASQASRVQTTPKYPGAFFIKSSQPIVLAPMSAQKPVERAFFMSKAAISDNLEKEMRKALENGIKILEYAASKKSSAPDWQKHL